MSSRRALGLCASASLLASLVGCGGNVAPADVAPAPERPLPTATQSTCGSEATQRVNVIARESDDNHTGRDTRGPLGATFSDCPASAAVRIDPFTPTGPSSQVVIPVDRPRSVLAWGPGYLTTRGPLISFDSPRFRGPGFSAAVEGLWAEEWRPRLSAAQAVAPTLVVFVGDGTGAGSDPGVPCHGAGVTMQLPDAPHATFGYLDATPTHAISAAPVTSDAGVIVVGGLSAGAPPHATFNPPAGCVVRDVTTVAPLENGVVSIQYVWLAPAG